MPRGEPPTCTARGKAARWARACRPRTCGGGITRRWRRRATTRQAGKALETAYELLLEGIGTLSDEGLRRSYLNKIDSHRAIVRAWIAHARAARFSAKRRAAHLAGEADLRAPFERLVDTGMRLNELRSAAELHEFLVDEVTELSGAERVLLVLDAPEGRGSPARSCPRAKTPTRCCRRSRRGSTRRAAPARQACAASPEGADALDQRSCLVAPLIAQQRLLGYLYADIDGAFGRFHDTDRDLLGMLAAQAAVALDNAQWSQGLEQKVAQRTEELQASNAMLEQRASELAVINSIQQARGVPRSTSRPSSTSSATSCARCSPPATSAIRWWDDGDETRSLTSTVTSTACGCIFRLAWSEPDGLVARFYRERKVRLINRRPSRPRSA